MGTTAEVRNIGSIICGRNLKKENLRISIITCLAQNQFSENQNRTLDLKFKAKDKYSCK